MKKLSGTWGKIDLFWPMNATEAQRAKVEEAAGMVLSARAQYPASTLADLYDPVTMSPALIKAHGATHRAKPRRSKKFCSLHFCG